MERAEQGAGCLIQTILQSSPVSVILSLNSRSSKAGFLTVDDEWCATPFDNTKPSEFESYIYPTNLACLFTASIPGDDALRGNLNNKSDEYSKYHSSFFYLAIKLVSFDSC